MALAAIGAIAAIVLSALFVLQRRVIGPLAELGFGITRIAEGDRRSPLDINATTREIAAMVTAVETLRQAALVADAAALHQRDAAERRQHVLRDALDILRTVEEPGHSLERNVALLSEGMEATVALVATLDIKSPPSLDTAAEAVRSGLREMHACSDDLDAAIAAARQAALDELPEAEIVARIMRVRAHIDRRETLVREFVHPCLLALRDATPLAGNAHAGDPEQRPLRDLLGGHFKLIESAVVTMASMRAAVARAAAMVTELPMELMPEAAE
jgi:HAMP domain-containing protein